MLRKRRVAKSRNERKNLHVPEGKTESNIRCQPKHAVTPKPMASGLRKLGTPGERFGIGAQNNTDGARPFNGWQDEFRYMANLDGARWRRLII
jgi:hypothetical protein